MSDSFYAVIVGSGVAGSLVAKSLLDSGKGPILMLEAGPDINMSDPGSWFHFVATDEAPYQATYDLRTDFSTSGVQQWNIVGGRVQGRGGTTNHWGGWMPRFKPEDFLQYTKTQQGINWPFTYDELEPYYAQAEQYLGVEGDSTNQNPPRTKPYPFEPAPFPISAGPFIDAFGDQRISYEHLPMARYGSSWNGNGPCQTTGTCHYCPVGGRFTGNQPLDSITSTQFEIRLNAPVTQVRMSSKSTAAGLTYMDMSSGQSVDIDATMVILAAGAFEIPKLLQRSTSTYWPKGIGNDNDLVGRYIVANQFFYVKGSAKSNPAQYEQELGFSNLCSRYFDSPAKQATGKLFLTMDYGTPTVDIASLMAQGKTAAEIQAAATGEAAWQLFGNLAPIAHAENRISNESGITRYGLPKTLIATPQEMYSPQAMEDYVVTCTKILTAMGCQGISHNSYPQRGDHASCTTRMATDPTVGVVDTSLKVHSTDNVYVLGNSVLPTLPAANPTLTMVALIYKSLAEFSDLLTRD